MTSLTWSHKPQPNPRNVTPHDGLKTGNRRAKILRVTEKILGHDEADSPGEGMCDDIVDITDDDSDAKSMDGSESGKSHLDDSPRIFVEGLCFEYPSSDESDEESLNARNREMLAPIEQEKGKKPLQKSLLVKIRLSMA
jgi:hypothetical protein